MGELHTHSVDGGDEANSMLGLRAKGRAYSNTTNTIPTAKYPESTYLRFGGGIFLFTF
jgi:hypothetical protein